MICLPMYSTLHKNKLWSCIEASSDSSTFFSDGVIAIGASMQDIFKIIYVARNVTPANAAKIAESSSNQLLKSTNAFLGSSLDFFLAVRTSRPH